MTTEELLATWEDGHVAEYRIGRAGRNAVEWEAWKRGPFYVQKHQDVVVCLTPRDEQTAEYNPRNAICGEKNGNITLNIEDYYLEIKLQRT